MTLTVEKITTILTASEDADFAEFKGYEDSAFLCEVGDVANAMYLHFDQTDYPCVFSYDADCDGAFEYATISARVPGPEGIYVSTSAETRQLTHDRSATGMDAAVAIWQALESLYAIALRSAKVLAEADRPTVNVKVDTFSRGRGLRGRTRAFILGVREFRSDLTMAYDDVARETAYDRGRDVAHRFTGRRYEQV